MAKFRCKASGNIVEFTVQYDIDTMEGHDGYEEVFEDEQDEEVVEEDTPQPVKRKGRPPKGIK